MAKRTSLLAGGALLAAGLLLSGCAAPTEPVAMTVTAPLGRAAPAGTVQVVVAGGSETDPGAAPRVSDRDLQTALEQSLLASGLFRLASPGDYRLEAFLVRVDQPTVGFTMTVSVEIEYKLFRTGQAAPLWQQAISSAHTAEVSDAFAGLKRVRLAIEGAVRKNIEHLLRELDRAKL